MTDATKEAKSNTELKQLVEWIASRKLYCKNRPDAANEAIWFCRMLLKKKHDTKHWRDLFYD